MIGGIITSAVLELLIYPVIYVIWRRRELPDRTEDATRWLPTLIPSEWFRQRLSKMIAPILPNRPWLQKSKNV
jgi:hypothetical protein